MAANIGTRPFVTSRKKQKIAHFLPSARERFVAPMFPEPILRKSLPCALAMSSPKGTEPSKYAPMIRIMNTIVLPAKR